MNIFGFDNYRDLLFEFIKTNETSRGYKAILAEAAGCHRSFLSQVLSGKADFSQEQGVALARFWGFNEREATYFVELIRLSRAGTPALKQLIENGLSQLKRAAKDLNQRFVHDNLDTPSSAAVYYSSWHFAALNILMTIPNFQTAAAASKRLNLPMEVIKQLLQSLKEMGLVEESEGKWKSIRSNLHLERGTLSHFVDHRNWRELASSKVLVNDPHNTFYSSVFSISQSDLERLHHLLMRFFDESRQLILASPEEELVVLNCDLFMV